MALIGNTNEEKIWNYLKSKGLNDYGIASLMGNLYAESALNPKNLQNTYEKKLGYSDEEYCIAVDNGTYTNFVKDGAGWGLAQWTYWSRKQNLLNYVKSVGKSVGDLEAQLEFLYKELSEGYSTSVLSVLKTATSILQASNAVLLKYERPADQSTAVQNKRVSYGQKYYNKYATFSSIKENIETIGDGKNMKYNVNNKPLVCMQTQSTCYKGTKKMTVKGVLWHSTGANNPWLKRYVQPSDNASDKAKWLELLGKNTYNNDWNHINRQAGMNCWIGKLADGTVTTVQTMPWDYRPWGCGSGLKGSCNNGWIQFEICEDNLTDKNYFNKVYNEACEITAYLCDMYNLDPHGYQTLNGVKVPVILCHQDSYRLGLGGNHGDVYNWFKKHGKDMDDVRNDVAAIMKRSGNINTIPESPSISVTPVIPDTSATSTIKKNDIVKIASNATYYSGKAVPAWVKNKTWVVMEVSGDRAVINESSDGKNAINSAINTKFLTVATSSGGSAAPTTPFAPAVFTPYLVKVTTDVLNIRKGAGTNYGVSGVIKNRGIYTIVDEATGKGATKWGLLKSYKQNRNGWIALDYTKRI